MRPSTLLLAVLLTPLACSTPQIASLDPIPLTPQSNEEIDLSYVVLLVDASGSMTKRGLFPQEKATVESFTGTMPEGDYRAGQISFGGSEREVEALDAYSRDRMNRGADELVFLDKDTPLDDVLLETRALLRGRPGKAAIVLFSDGRPTTAEGAKPGDAQALWASDQIIASRTSPTCFHTIQTSDDPAGEAFLRQLSGKTSCGSYSTSESLGNIASMHSIQRAVFLGARPPQVAAAPLDSDGDGVTDDRDQCPGTPAGVSVTPQGCWLGEPILFGFDSTELNQESRARLDRIAEALAENPDFRIRVEGNTDSRGSQAYNLSLGEKRAEAAQSYLESRGIVADRFEVLTWGDEKPAYSNDTEANRARNRRVDFSRAP